MKKIIIAVMIVIVIVVIIWIVFIKRPVFLDKLFFKKTTEESVQLPKVNPFKTETNPFLDSYKNPFSNQ
ncbi:MAG: hypothetical protein WC822_00150 [Candidatus Paceibacterota bacterium]|jgi:uncharacterized protein YxeA